MRAHTLILFTIAMSGAANGSAEQPRILAPSLGRPAFAAPGGVLHVIAKWPPDLAQLSAELVGPAPVRAHYALTPAHELPELHENETLDFRAPATIPPDTYDLEVRCAGRMLRQPHCVAITTEPAPLRMVHLSNMNIGDVAAPHFDGGLADEINLLAPSVIVGTGDYVDATHPERRAGWTEFMEFCARLRAPLILACGDHEDMELYGQFIAPSPIGVIDAGRVRFVVLFDIPSAPVHQDSEQIAWVERALHGSGACELTCIVSHDESPNLLRYWSRNGTLAESVRNSRIGLWFVGGGREWDGREYASLVGAARPMRYVRTPSASGCLRDGADGTPRFRVIDLRGPRISEPGAPATAPAPALAAGKLRCTCCSQNDGSEATVTWRLANDHPFTLSGLELRGFVRKSGDKQPAGRGGQIEQIIDRARYWEVRVRLDVADKSAGFVQVGTEVVDSPISVRFDGTKQLSLQNRTTPDGVEYAEATPATMSVQLENRGTVELSLSPRIRLDGGMLAYRIAGEIGPFAAIYRLLLKPGESLGLEIDLSALRTAPGRGTLQVYVDDGLPECVPLELVRAIPEQK